MMFECDDVEFVSNRQKRMNFLLQNCCTNLNFNFAEIMAYDLKKFGTGTFSFSILSLKM